MPGALVILGETFGGRGRIAWLLLLLLILLIFRLTLLLFLLFLRLTLLWLILLWLILLLRLILCLLRLTLLLLLRIFLIRILLVRSLENLVQPALSNGVKIGFKLDDVRHLRRSGVALVYRHGQLDVNQGSGIAIARTIRHIQRDGNISSFACQQFNFANVPTIGDASYFSVATRFCVCTAV